MTFDLQTIGKKIIALPGRPLFMLDRDVAELYETETRTVNQAVKRNPDRFPEDFCFELTEEEVQEMIKTRYGGDITRFERLFEITDCDFKIDGRGGRRRGFPYGFTREGCNMLSAVLSTPVAVQRSIQIVRAFTALERFSGQSIKDSFMVDAPDTPFLPSGLQIQQLRELYGNEATKQILQDHCGIYVGGPRSSITPVEARIIRKNNPNKRKRNEVIAALIDRGVNREIIAAISGMSRKSLYNCYTTHYKKRGYDN
jgi:hypothetical protein